MHAATAGGARACRQSGATRAFSSALPKCSTGGRPICGGSPAARAATKVSTRVSRATRVHAASWWRARRTRAVALAWRERACRPSTRPHTTPPEPQRQISSMRMSSWNASKPFSHRRRQLPALCQRPNRLDPAAPPASHARRTHLRRRSGERHGPGWPHHTGQQPRRICLRKELSRHRLGAVPGVAVRRHLGVDERADLLAERAVRGGVVRAAPTTGGAGVSVPPLQRLGAAAAASHLL